MLPGTLRGNAPGQMTRDYTYGGFWGGPQPAIAGNVPENVAMERVKQGMTNSPINKYIQAIGTYHCPGDLRTKRLRRGAGWAWVSYSKMDGMNGGMWPQKPFIKLSTINEPSSSALFVEESDPRTENLGTWVMEKNSWVDGFAIFHGFNSTFSFADNHAETHRWVNPTTIRAAQDFAAGKSVFNWGGAGAANRDFLWMWNNYKFIGWTPL